MHTIVLEYIIAIAEERSVTRAADRFYLSHPALSRHLRRIESELGTPLFVRTRRGMELTPVGIVFVNDAREILRIEAELMRDLRMD